MIIYLSTYQYVYWAVTCDWYVTDTLNVHCMPAAVLDAGDTDMREATFTSFTKLTFSLKEDRK